MPLTSKNVKTEALQKSAVKCINRESFASYRSEKYNNELKSRNILSMKLKFIYNDLVLFYQITNKLVPSIDFPAYISLFQPESIRFARSSAAVHNQTDTSMYGCGAVATIDVLRHSYFYRTTKFWSKLHHSIMQCEGLSTYKTALKKCLWSGDIEWPD